MMRTKIIKIAAGLALAAGYSLLCYAQRGYWNLLSDLLVIGIAAALYLTLSTGLKTDNDEAEDERREREEVYMRVIRTTDGIRKSNTDATNNTKTHVI